jgi:hypothetical protein
MQPLPGHEVVERYHLEVRAKLLEVAAVLDRIDRGGGPAGGEPRLKKIREAIALLQSASPDRAERLQMLFSLPFSADWRHEMNLAG